MVTFSVVIPAYNAEKYLKRCLDSVLAGSFADYEIIIVNDGSTDSTEKIAREYEERHANIVVLSQKNQGLSAARNAGIEKINGEYFILLDSDDSIEKDLLHNLNESLYNEPDLVRYQVRDIIGNEVKEYQETPFSGLNGKEAFRAITEYHYVEVACCYAYKTSFFREHDFKFSVGRYHEDFGLIPAVIVTANTVNSINYIGYNYYQNEGSITHQNEYEKTRKKAFDVLTLAEELNKYDGGAYYKSFVANTAILKAASLNDEDFKAYEKKLKEMKIYDNLLDDTLARKAKKMLIKASLKAYLRTLGK